LFEQIDVIKKYIYWGRIDFYNHICKAVYLMLRYEYAHTVQNLQQYRCNNAAMLLQHAMMLQCCSIVAAVVACTLCCKD